MPYPQHWLFVMGGNLTSTVAEEIWECTIRGRPATGSSHTYGDEDAVLDSISGAVHAWYENPDNLLRSDSTLNYLKLNEIGPDGRYAHPVSHTHDYTTPAAGTTTPTGPTILTAAISWRTARARGIAANGRIYPPVAPTFSNSSDRIAPASVTALVAAGASLLDAISNPSSSVFEIGPAVVSKGAGGGVGAGAIENITAVRVGNVIDVQRRRKDALREVYTSAAWP